jgi:hypothetical protein
VLAVFSDPADHAADGGNDAAGSTDGGSDFGSIPSLASATDTSSSGAADFPHEQDLGGFDLDDDLPDLAPVSPRPLRTPNPSSVTAAFAELCALYDAVDTEARLPEQELSATALMIHDGHTDDGGALVASLVGGATLPFILDSAASFNVSPATDDVNTVFASTSPSHAYARVADGNTTRSSLTGTTVVLFGHPDGDGAGESYEFPFERLKGCTDRIISVPFLASIGFALHLDNDRPHLVTPGGTVVDVTRTSSNARAMWTLPLTFTGEPGHARVAASAQPLVASLIHVNAKTVGMGAFEDMVILATSADASTPAPASDPPAATLQSGRFAALTGAPLHAALGHLTDEKFRALRRHSTGLAKGSTIPQQHRRQCRGCMLGSLTRSDVPSVAPYSTRGRFLKGERWGMDFGRTFPTSIWGKTSYVILVEDQTLFVKLYFINSHTEVWHALREFIPWCRRTFGAVVKSLKPDSDPIWTSGRSVDPDTAEAKLFSTEFDVTFERTAPYTQAANVAENVQRPLLALTNTQLVHASLTSKLWEPSADTAATILNMLPKPGSTRPLLQHDVSPHEAMFGCMPDLSRLAGAFGSLCYVHVAGSKPSQLTNTSRAALYFGIAPGSSGWRVLMLDTMTLATSLHVTIDHNLRRRPAILADSDMLRRDDAPGKMLANVSRERSLFDGHSISGIIVLDPLTSRPERVIEIHDAYGSSENHLTTVAGTPCLDVAGSSLPEPEVPTAPRSALSPPVAAAPTASPVTAIAPGSGSSTPSTAVSTRSRLPDDTRITVQQHNPKKGASAERYELYKHATTVGAYLEHSKPGDLNWDIKRGYVTVEPTAALAMLDPSIVCLSTLHTGGAPSAAATSAGPYPTMDLLSRSVADEVAARMAALGPPSELDLGPTFLDGVVSSAIAASSPSTSGSTISQRPSDPAGPKDLRGHPHRDAFVRSMVSEARQLLDKYKTLRPVTEDDVHEARRSDPDHVRVVPSMWVLVSKYHANGAFDRTKARLVACENNSKFHVPDTWSPTVALSSVRLLLDIAAHFGAHLLELDVSGAYLLGKRSSRSRVFVRLPPNLDLVRDLWDDPRLRYADADGKKMFFEADTNYYGLQDAGKIWYECFREWITSPVMNFNAATGDPCVYVLRTSDGFIFVCVYVDDVLAVFSTLDLKAWFVAQFEQRFDQSPLHDHDDHNEFLGIQIRSNAERTALSLNTPRVFDRLQQRFDDLDLPDLIPVAPRRTPLPPDAMEMIFDPISETNTLVPPEQIHVPALLGVAGWVVMAVRPAEALTAAVLGRMARNPTRSYVRVLLHFLSYLLHTRDDELTLRGGDATQFVTDVDSSWANCPGTQRSWFGYCLRTDGGCFMWRSKLAPSVALSSRDAEAIAAVFAVRAMLAVQILLCDLGFVTPDPLLLRVDNAATVQNTTTDLVHRDSRHMAIRLAFLREHVRNGLINVEHVRTALNLADIFTKILPAADHARIRRVLMGMMD